MKYFTLLILPFFLMSCGTDPDVDEPETETVRIGSFDVVTNLETNETHAEWVGEASPKMKQEESDTTWYDAPDGQSIVIDKREEKAYFTYYDSTYTVKDMDRFSNENFENPIPARMSWWANGFTDDAMFAVQSMAYKCDEEYDFPDEEYFQLSYTIDDTSAHVKLFNINGMIDAIHHIMCIE